MKKLFRKWKAGFRLEWRWALLCKLLVEEYYGFLENAAEVWTGFKALLVLVISAAAFLPWYAYRFTPRIIILSSRFDDESLERVERINAKRAEERRSPKKQGDNSEAAP